MGAIEVDQRLADHEEDDLFGKVDANLVGVDLNRIAADRVSVDIARQSVDHFSFVELIPQRPCQQSDQLGSIGANRLLPRFSLCRNCSTTFSTSS